MLLFFFFKIAWSRLAEEYVAAGFILQEREISDVPNDDYTKSLLMVVQRQDYFIHGQVRRNDLSLFHWTLRSMFILIPILSFFLHIFISLFTRSNISSFFLFFSRLTLKLSCAMNFLIYPHDTQECKLQMESREWIFTNYLTL